MKVADFLELNELTGADLARQLDKSPETVNSRRRDDKDIPDEWWPDLIALGYQQDASAPPPDGGGPSPDDGYRAADSAPQAPDGTPLAYPTYAKLDMGSVAGHVEGIYSFMGSYVVPMADPLMGECLVASAPQAGEAWAKWIAANPQVAAWLERLMIGTPMGEVIGVHVGIFLSYIMARTAAEAFAREQRSDTSGQSSPADDGTEPSPVVEAA